MPGTIAGFQLGGLLSSSFNLGLISVSGSLLEGERDIGDLAKVFGVGFISGIVSGTGAFGLAYTGWLGRYAAQVASTGATNALHDWATTGRVDRFRFGLHGFNFSTNFRDFSFDGFNTTYWIAQGVTLLNGLVGYAMGNGGLGWSWDSLSLMSRGGVVGWIQNQVGAGGFTVYSVHHYTSHTLEHELTHLWQARFAGEIWFTHYLLDSVTAISSDGPGSAGHHYEDQAYGQGGRGFY